MSHSATKSLDDVSSPQTGATVSFDEPKIPVVQYFSSGASYVAGEIQISLDGINFVNAGSIGLNGITQASYKALFARVHLTTIDAGSITVLIDG